MHTPLSLRRSAVLVASGLLAVTLLALVAGALFAQDGGTPPDPDFVFRMPEAANLEGEKTVSRATAPAGATIEYTLVVSNSGDSSLASIWLTDTLPLGLTYAAGTLNVPPGTLYGTSPQVITWTGALPANAQVSLTFDAILSDTLTIGDILTNTMVITGGGQTITRTAATTVITATESVTNYLPIIQKPLPNAPSLSIQATRPSSNNEWTVSWTVSDDQYVTNYEVHESQNINFDSYTVIDAGTATSINVEHDASYNNVYYYRVRANGPWGAGQFSNVVDVVGNYYDDFSSEASDWQVRRMSYLEETYAYYLDGNLVVLIDDRWDWAIASPMKPAPEPPYAIEYYARVNDASNLVSGGAFFGGDWNGEPCPEIGNVYETDNCFNQFYNFNFIFYGPLKLLHEQVDELYWCPSCGGSALKRLGPTQVVDPILANGPSLNWHTYRIEVRSDGARLYVDDDFVKHFTDTTYVNRPYFGTFASTGEYKPSIWLYDYYKVTHLDS